MMRGDTVVTKEKLVLIGNGMAGIRTLEELLALAPESYDITVFGAEPHPNYNRIMLSPVLAGERSVDDIILNSREWYRQHGITLHSGDPVVEIDRTNRRITSRRGLQLRYDKLIIATGSEPFIIPVPGSNLDGVIGFRDIGDVETMLQATRHFSKAVVIGGGLLGLEAANGLAKHGMDVTVVHLLDTLMERQLDPPAANLLRESLEARGLKFLMNHQTSAILGNARVTGVRFADGTETPADLVVMAVGIRPNTSLAKAAGLQCERGIVVSDTLQTDDPRIYAVGECVQHRGECYGLVAPLYDQAKVCARQLEGDTDARYEGSMTSTKLKVTGIDLFSAGNFLGGEDCEEIIYSDPSAGIYKRLVIHNNRIEGSVLYGDTRDGGWYFQLMRDGTDIDDIREYLLFGRAYVRDSAQIEGGKPVAQTPSVPANVLAEEQQRESRASL